MTDDEVSDRVSAAFAAHHQRLKALGAPAGAVFVDPVYEAARQRSLDQLKADLTPVVIHLAAQEPPPPELEMRSFAS